MWRRIGWFPEFFIFYFAATRSDSATAAQSYLAALKNTNF